jgi:WD40 repeat protein
MDSATRRRMGAGWRFIARSPRTLLVYRLPGLEPVATLTHRGNIGTVKFSPSGNEIAVSARQQMEIWNTTTWQRTRVLTNVIDVIYTLDERLVWLQRNYRTAGLYEAQSLELVLPLPANRLPLALSPDGHHLAVSRDSRHLQVWDIPKLRNELRQLGVDWKDNQPDP